MKSSTDYDLHRLHFRMYSRKGNQQSLYQLFQRIESLDEQNLTSILDSFFQASETTDDFLNLFGVYRFLLLRKDPISDKLAEQMECQHIKLMNGLPKIGGVESVELLVFVLKNINLAMMEGYFSKEKEEFHLEYAFLLKLRSFNHEEADDRHLIQFYTESVKLLRNMKMRHDVPHVLVQIKKAISARPSMVSCFSILTDMEDVKPRTAFIENHPDDLVPLLSLLIIHASLAFLFSDYGIDESRMWANIVSLVEFDSGMYPLFFKIFATDTDALYEALNLMITRQLTGPLNPVKFYSVMVHGAVDGRSFYENHIHRNPDGMQFTFSILKSINQNRFDVDEDMRSPESYTLHSSLRHHFLDLIEDDLLEFNPAPYLKQLNMYLEQ